MRAFMGDRAYVRPNATASVFVSLCLCIDVSVSLRVCVSVSRLRCVCLSAYLGFLPLVSQRLQVDVESVNSHKSSLGIDWLS